LARYTRLLKIVLQNPSGIHLDASLRATLEHYQTKVRVTLQHSLRKFPAAQDLPHACPAPLTVLA
jgi:hypothetical protein